MADINAVVVSFTDRAKAFEAFSALKGIAADGRVGLRSAHLVTRDEQGRLSVPEGVRTDGATGTWGGGIVGLLIGILGGPIGMLFGWTGGMLVGGAFDASRADRSLGVLDEISDSIPLGGTAIIAEAEEFALEVLDNEMAALGGQVFRRPAEAVLAELEAAEDSYQAAKKDADRRAREERREERRENFEERKTALKDKLGLS